MHKKLINLPVKSIDISLCPSSSGTKDSCLTRTFWPPSSVTREQNIFAKIQENNYNSLKIYLILCLQLPARAVALCTFSKTRRLHPISGFPPVSSELVAGILAFLRDPRLPVPELAVVRSQSWLNQNRIQRITSVKLSYPHTHQRTEPPHDVTCRI